jgi:hypothetical protein
MFCRTYGVSAPTLRSWLTRYDAEASLFDKVKSLGHDITDRNAARLRSAGGVQKEIRFQ